ncbi:MAG: energy transducer TonB [Acidobacteriota bacterium]
MFEQSMLLPYASGKKAGALAASLAVQTLAVGTLLLIPMLYTDRLPFAQLQLPTFLPAAPPPEIAKSKPIRRTRTVARVWHPFTSPTSIPSLNRQLDFIDDAPAALDRIDSGAFMPPVPHIIFTQVLPPPPPPQVHESASNQPITVTSEIQSAKLIRKVQPVYSKLAIIARISGTVRLTGIIGKDGTIQQLQVLSGPPLLVAAAVDAVRQWVYRPTLLNGKPVEVIAPINVNFTLSQ